MYGSCTNNTVKVLHSGIGTNSRMEHTRKSLSVQATMSSHGRAVIAELAQKFKPAGNTTVDKG